MDLSRFDDSQPLLLARLNDGRELSILPCNCGHCGNEWFTPWLSREWMPSFCPYCGIKFIRVETGDPPSAMDGEGE